MKYASILLVSAGFISVVLLGGAAQAETIRRACLQSDRGGTQTVCRCIQSAADQTLSNRDQRRAAKFFRDPEEAQRVRRSDRSRDEAFWERYRVFGERAEQSCRS